MKKKITLKEKEEFYAIDIFRIIAAVLVIAIHTGPLLTVNKYANYWLVNVIARLAVPFFFITSGFFLAPKLNDKDKVKKYLKHLLTLYILYSVIYLPIVIYEFSGNGYTILDCIKVYIQEFFFTGSYMHLWYFMALSVSVILLYLLKTKLKIEDKTLMVICFILFVIEVAYNGYRIQILNDSLIGQITSLYKSIFITTRNGLFFGLPFLFAGYYIRKNEDKIYNIGFSKYFIISFILLNIEIISIYYNFHTVGQDSCYMLLPTTVLLFLSLSFIRIDKDFKEKCISIRKISTITYGIHMLIVFILYMIGSHFSMSISFLLNYILTVIFSIMISIGIYSLSNKFKFLRYLY